VVIVTETPGSTDDKGPSLAVGGLLILVGVLWLLSEALDIDVWSAGWPFFVIVPGVAGLASGLAGRGGLGAAVPGSVVTVLGLLLLYQNATGHWESWAYAWALVAPGGVGAALLLTGMRTGDDEMQARGVAVLTTALGLFAAGFVVFEVLIGVSGRDFGVGADIVLPSLLIGVGGYLVVRSAGRRS
jgi:hypothetical protein